MKKILFSLALAILGLFVFAIPAKADSVSTNFDSYILGSINGQDGWVSLGTAGSSCAGVNYDHAVSGSLSTTGFGTQSLRISNAVTSGCFGDMTFAKPLTDAVGEINSTAGTFSAGTLQRHFEMQFDIASAVPGAQQPGLSMSVSPDRGDGSRMSYLRFEDGVSGLNIFFDDVQGTVPFGTDGCKTIVCGNFVETQVGTNLNRAIPHRIKLTLDAIDGPSNDVVKVWIDGVLVKTGTSWEDYYRFDPEASAEQSPRIVKTVIFRTGGTAVPANATYGFLFDNLSLLSGPKPTTTPTDKTQCKDDGWKTFTNPVFKNQGDCVSFVTTQRLVDTVTVDSANSNSVASTYTLDSTKWYRFEVSGTWTNDGLNVADAEYASNNAWSTFFDGYNITPWQLGPDEFDLQVNGSFINWGAFTPTHTYSYMFKGIGDKVNFLVFDGQNNVSIPSWYGDNSGSLTVKIFEIR